MEQTILSLIKNQAKVSPSANAILSKNNLPLTYPKLLECIQHTAAQLTAYGVCRESTVAIVLPNGPEMAVATLAVSSVATCAPLNPEYRDSEFEFYLQDLEASFLLVEKHSQSAVIDVARKLNIPIIYLIPSTGKVSGVFSLNSDVPEEHRHIEYSRPNDIALILHTSGTTSRPKMVPLTQKNICATANNMANALQLTSDDICLNVMPMFHIGGLVDLLSVPLSVGGSVVCSDHFSAHHLIEHVTEFNPTWCQVVPTMLQDIITQFYSKPELLANSSLRFMRSVAAALPTNLQEEFERIFLKPVIEVYGMTETTTLITTNPLPPNLRKTGSVGLPAGPEVAILYDDIVSILPNVNGEVVVRGSNVMDGYLKSNNNDTFFDDWFRTGDVGYFDKDGYLFLMGRSKELINRGGEKISPNEIDDILQKMESIESVATFAIKHDLLGETVAVAVCKKPETSIIEQDVISFLSKKIAYFKMPECVFFVDSLPKTASGKIKRSALSELFSIDDYKPSKSSKKLVGEVTKVGEVIISLWESVLNVSGIKSEDNFFDLGGDSLKAATFINQLENMTGERVFISAIFDAPTVVELEALLQEEYNDIYIGLTQEENNSVNDREEFEF